MRLTGILLIGMMISACIGMSLMHPRQANSTPPADVPHAKPSMQITPLIVLKPGESKEMLFSVWCTVGATRGGGFNLAEMKNGKPVFTNSTLKGNRKFTKGGVMISVPDFTQGREFASAPEFAPLRELNYDAFRVSVTAAADAEPGLMEMHLLDSTCSGDCRTNFRVLVTQ